MKATRAQIELRCEELLRIRLDGAEFWDVREYVREKEREPDTVWTLSEGSKPLSDATLWRYLGRVDILIAESCRATRKKLFRRHLAQRRNLYAKAVSAGDLRTALAVVRDEAELEGLYPPTKVAPTSPDGRKQYGELSDADRAAALANLYARVGTANGEPPSVRPADGD